MAEIWKGKKKISFLFAAGFTMHFTVKKHLNHNLFKFAAFEDVKNVLKIKGRVFLYG